MWKFLTGMDLQRLWLHYKSPPGPAKDYYDVSFPWPEDDYDQIEYVAIDFETTGLDPENDEIVSVGWVVIRDMKICLGESGYSLVKPINGVSKESAVVHHILDRHLENAPEIDEVLKQVLNVLAGRVLVAHNSQIETGFLNTAFLKYYGVRFEIFSVDTLALEHKRMTARNESIGQGDLRLPAVRRRYGLPRHGEHNALTDALACGELFLAQASKRAEKGKLVLRELIS